MRSISPGKPDSRSALQSRKDATRIFSRNRIAKILPAALLVVLALAGAEAETAYLRKALGVEIGFSRADWLDVYMDMSESAHMDDRLARVEERVSPVDAGGAGGFMKQALDYESAASAGVPARVLALAERMTAFYNEMVDVALEGEARYADMSGYAAIWDVKMREYPRVHAHATMLGYYDSADCR